MATLILNANGSSPISVACQQARKAAPRLVGSVTTSFNGANRSSIRGQAKVIPILASFVDTATEATIQAAVMNGVQINCSGDILGNVQTLCSIDSVDSRMIPGLPGYFEMSFTLNEVNASTVLLKYAPGDTITGESLTRSTAAYQTDATGLLVSKAINVKRDGHYIGGLQYLLLEGPRTNVVIRNRDLTQAAWVKTNMTTAQTEIGADGAVNSCTRLTATAGNATALQTIVLAASTQFQTAYVKRITGTGTVQMTMDNGATWTNITIVGGSFTRVSIPVQSITNPVVGFRIVTSGDAINVDFVQNEAGTFASSPIATTTVAVTRGADFYSLPFTTPPQEMTVYAKTVELGTISTANARLFEIAAAADTAPQFLSYAPAGMYSTNHSNGTTAVTSTMGTAPVQNDIVELVSHLFGDGSVDTTQSLNAAASTAATQSSSNAMSTAWSGLLCWLNSAGTSGSVGFVAIRSFKIVAGCRSLTEMRAA